VVYESALGQKFREQMPVAARWAYFDHAATASISAPAEATVHFWARQAAEQGDTAWPEWERQVEQVRDSVAQLIGAMPQEVALVPNTTAGIGFVAEGYPWRAGDNVVTLANEFPTNLYPWMNLASRGVETRRVAVDQWSVDLNRVAEACDARTRLLAVSWVSYVTGYRIDVAEVVRLAHERGILVVLDAIQGLGVFPLDVRQAGVDFLAADGHKWLLGPEGAGVFFVRADHLNLLRPQNVGWHSVVRAHEFGRGELALRTDAARYEGGSQNMVGTLALGASLRMLAELGLSSKQSPLADRVLEITAEIVDRLESAGAVIVGGRDDRHRSGIVSFDLPGRDLAAVRRHCLERGVVLSVRGGRLRVSPHAYANEEDVHRLVTALASPA
jgi:cysteine desulfurase / selenocysteine lyase